MKRSKFGYVAALAILPAGLIGCASNDRRVETTPQEGDYIVATPHTQAPTAFVAGSTVRAQDASISNELPGTVRSGVKAQFPDAVILDMREGSNDEWVVYVQTQNVIRELHVRASDGLVLSSDNALTTQMAIEALPSNVKTVASSRQPGGIIYNVEQVGDAEPATWRIYTLSDGEQYFVDASSAGMMVAEGRANDASRAHFATSPMNTGNRVEAASIEDSSGWRTTTPASAQPSLKVEKRESNMNQRDHDDDMDHEDLHDHHDPD